MKLDDVKSFYSRKGPYLLCGQKKNENLLGTFIISLPFVGKKDTNYQIKFTLNLP